MNIDGKTQLIAHFGYPTSSFKAPMIYNPYFESIGVNAAVVPMGVSSEDYNGALPIILRMSNIVGALITMPHKVTTLAMLDEMSTAARISGACNAVRKRDDGALVGDMFDGEGFVRGLMRKGCSIAGASVLVVGSGGVGSSIAASLGAAGIARIGLYDVNAAMMDMLAQRLIRHYPSLAIKTGDNDPEGYDIIVNASPLGMNDGDPMPVDVNRIAATSFVGDVVMKREMTDFLNASSASGCKVQVGVDMLFEQIPANLEFFGFPTTTADNLRHLARIGY